MDRLAIFVDAGYLMSQLGKIKTNGERANRATLGIVDPRQLAQLLIDTSKKLIGNQCLLRLYWYDGAKNGQLTAEHRAIVSVDDIQLRLGSINNVGQQKGVDSRIVTDLIDLAQKHAISDAVVVSGDADLAVGIEIAQRSGVRIGLLGFAGKSLQGNRLVKHSQSEEIVLITDRHQVIHPNESWLETLSHIPAVQSPMLDLVVASSSDSATVVKSTEAKPQRLGDLESAVMQFYEGLKEKPASDQLLPSIPGNIDKPMLMSIKNSLGRLLTEQEKRQARALFRGAAEKAEK